ncbi:MAG TPA: magnesium transporter CorA family protein [Elusimicrobiales bacterium]|nr:magnesium transporter CorA family protein [Elusimicrobiales bacterium]
MIKKYTIINHNIVETEENERIIVLVSPTQEEKEEKINKFNIDPHNLNSSLDPEEPSRIEFEEGRIEVIFKRPKNYSSKDHYLFKVQSLGLFLSNEKLIVVIGEECNLFVGKYFKNVIGIKEIFLKLIYNSIFHFIEHLKVINMIADEIETKISKAMDNKYLIHMFTLEKSLVYYASAITSNSFVLEKLKYQAPKFGFKERSMEYLEDIIIENNQAKIQSDIYLQVFSSLMDARASIINNNMNIWLKTLTIITIAIAVPNFFASMGGMSEIERIMGIDNVRAAQGIFLIFSIVMAYLIFIVFRKLERKGIFDK